MIAAFTLSAVLAAGACNVSVGHRVAVYDRQADPRVFLWDGRDKPAAYARNGWTISVIRHAHLLAANTNVEIVTPCDLKDNSVGVKVLTGWYTGHFGWVSLPDINPIHPVS